MNNSGQFHLSRLNHSRPPRVPPDNPSAACGNAEKAPVATATDADFGYACYIGTCTSGLATPLASTDCTSTLAMSSFGTDVAPLSSNGSGLVVVP